MFLFVYFFPLLSLLGPLHQPHIHIYSTSTPPPNKNTTKTQVRDAEGASNLALWEAYVLGEAAGGRGEEAARVARTALGLAAGAPEVVWFEKDGLYIYVCVGGGGGGAHILIERLIDAVTLAFSFSFFYFFFQNQHHQRPAPL